MLKHVVAGAAGMAALALTSTAAPATVVTYNFNTAFAGALSEGVAPFLTLEIDDAVVPGSVRLTFSAPGLSETEYVQQINLNLDPALNSGDLTFTNFQIYSGVLLHPMVTLGNDTLEGGGGGLFDMQFTFAVSGGGFSRRFNAGESFSLDFDGIAGLNANSFNFLSTPPAANGIQLLAAHIEGIGASAADGWHTVPEPAAVSLALLGLGPSCLRRRSGPRRISA